MATYDALNTKTIATIRKLIPQGRRKAGIATIGLRRSYRATLEKMGFTDDQSYTAWEDCCDIADLENMAEAA